MANTSVVRARTTQPTMDQRAARPTEGGTRTWTWRRAFIVSTSVTPGAVGGPAPGWFAVVDGLGRQLLEGRLDLLGLLGGGALVRPRIVPRPGPGGVGHDAAPGGPVGRARVVLRPPRRDRRWPT